MHHWLDHIASGPLLCAHHGMIWAISILRIGMVRVWLRGRRGRIMLSLVDWGHHYVLWNM